MTTSVLARGVVRLPETTAAAQALIEQHLDNVPFTGVCANCGEITPCPSRILAHAAFWRLGALPRRPRHHRSTT